MLRGSAHGPGEAAPCSHARPGEGCVPVFREALAWEMGPIQRISGSTGPGRLASP